MKKSAIGLILALGLSGSVQAGVSCSVPFQLQNNTVADATQVMANYNALITCLGNAASAGANNDITSLNALSTPIPLSEGGSTIYIGGTSTGSANAQLIASTTPTGFSLTAGKRVTFIAGFSNTGATTLNVNSLGAINLYRRTQLGISSVVGGELVVGQLVEAVYDGSQFQLLNQALVGEGRDWFTLTAPTGWLFRDGSSLLRTDYPDLFAVIGTTYGAVDGTHFSLPDERGRLSAMRDTVGRMTTTCPAAATLGTGCGGQTTALGTTNLPAYTPSGSIATGVRGDAIVIGTPGAGQSNYTGGVAVPQASKTGDDGTLAVFTGTAQGGVATPFAILDPSLIVNKIIKY